MDEIMNRLTKEQAAGLIALNKGQLVHTHYSGDKLRVDTVHGEHSYEWRNGQWCEPLELPVEESFEFKVLSPA